MIRVFPKFAFFDTFQKDGRAAGLMVLSSEVEVDHLFESFEFDSFEDLQFCEGGFSWVETGALVLSVSLVFFFIYLGSS